MTFDADLTSAPQERTKHTIDICCDTLDHAVVLCGARISNVDTRYHGEILGRFLS
jgi:hypothetical protein